MFLEHAVPGSKLINYYTNTDLLWNVFNALRYEFKAILLCNRGNTLEKIEYTGYLYDFTGQFKTNSINIPLSS